MPGGFGLAAKALSSAREKARGIRQEDEDRAKQEEQSEFARLALMLSLQDRGVVPGEQRENITAELPDVGTIGGPMPRRAPTPVDTGIQDPSRYVSLGRAGGQEYFRDKAQQIAAERAAAEDARLKRALIISQTRENDANADKLLRPADPDKAAMPRTMQTARGIVQWNPETKAWEDTGEKPFVPPQRDSPVQQDLKEQRRFQRSQALQQDYKSNPAVKTGYELANVAAGIKAALSGDSPMDDLSVVYQTVKMFDPGSVVREGEISLMRSAQSLPQEVRNLVQKWNTGRILLPEMRTAIARMVDAKIAEQDKAIQPVQRDVGEMARRYGVEQDSAFVAPSPFRGLQAGNKERPPIEQRISELKAQNLSKDAAKALLRREGYEVP